MTKVTQFRVFRVWPDRSESLIYEGLYDEDRLGGAAARLYIRDGELHVGSYFNHSASIVFTPGQSSVRFETRDVDVSA